MNVKYQISNVEITKINNKKKTNINDKKYFKM